MRQIQGLEMMFLEIPCDLVGFVVTGNLQTDKHMSFLFIANTIDEFGDVAGADQFAEALEAAAFFGNRYREYGFTCFADLGALGDEAQAVEIHIGTAGNRDQILTLNWFLADFGALHIFLDACYGHFQALFGVSMAVAPGQAIAVIGANGAGKSTLLKSIAGLVHALGILDWKRALLLKHDGIEVAVLDCL